jgi:predicted CxxxxCH...CXXCH cytochrome family protein
MGRKIAKQIKGMNRWVKGLLIMTLTVLVSSLMFQGLLKPGISDSATNTYRFTADTAAVNVGVDGQTNVGLANGATAGGKYSLAIPTYNGTGYINVPASATTTLATLYGPVYSGNTVLTAPALRLAQRAGSSSGQTTQAQVIDYDPVTGSNTTIWTATGANYTSTSTGYTTLSFGTANAYTISHGHRVKIVVSATNNSTSTGRLYFYSSTTNSSYFTVTENYPTSTTEVANIADYNGGNITGVTQGQQNIAMLSFQMLTNATSSTTWTGGKLDRIGGNTNLDDATFAVYLDSNNDGVFNPTVDQKISDETSFTQLAGQAYTLVIPQTITTTAKRYFVVFNLSPAAASGTTVGAQILDETYFSVGANNMNPMIAGASSTISIIANDGNQPVAKTYQVDFNSGTTFATPLPATGATATNTACTTSASSYSTAVYGLLNYPSHTCTSPAATNYNTLTTSGSITLYLNGAGFGTNLTKLQGGSFVFYGATGTSGTASTLKAALFYVMADGTKVTFPSAYDGTVSLGTSTTLAARTITFDAANYNLANVPRGARLGMTLTATGASARIALNSAAGAKLVMQETAAVSNGVDIGDGKVIPDANVTAGATGKVVDAFTMVAGTSQTITSITVNGTNANSTNVSRVTVYRKGAGNANYAAQEDGDVKIGETQSFTNGNAVVPVNEAVGTTLNRYLVVYDIAAAAVVGQRITGLVTAIGGASSDVIADTSSAGLTVVASTIVTEGNGEPASVSVGPGGTVKYLGAFGLYTNGPTDTINTVTVKLVDALSPAAVVDGAIALMEVVNQAGTTVYGSSSAPISGNTWRMTVSGLSASSTTSQCYVRITPKATVAGTFYVTGTISAITHAQTSNALFYNDATSATVTIDGIAPPNTTVSATTGSSPGDVNLAWSPVTDSNVNNAGVTYKVVRGPANSPAPTDCSSGTPVYDGPLTSVVDATGYNDGKSYTFGYRVCSADGVGNRSNGALASAAAKLPKIDRQPPTVAFINSPNQYVKTGGSADYNINIVNNDIGDCAPVTFAIALDTLPGSDSASFDNKVVVTPSTLTLNPNGAGGNVKITVKSLDSARQGDIVSFTVKAVAGDNSPYNKSASVPLVATVNNFGPMLHSSFSVGTKYGLWGARSTCNDCHINPDESTNNIKLISENVLTPLGRRPVSFTMLTSTTATTGVFGNEQRPVQNGSANICEVCHHNTKFHQYSSGKQVAAGSPLTHHNGGDCMECHPHRGGFKYVGGAEDCVSCHGYPPTRQIEMVSPPLNALGNSPADYGAHSRHAVDLKMACTTCHNNYTRNPMGNTNIEMGFAIRSSNYKGFAGSVSNGTIIVSANYNKLYTWASNSPGTLLVESPNQSVPSCSVYCHGGWTGGGGTNPVPTWVGSNQAECGACHNYTNADPPETGSHLKHASSGLFLENGVTVGGLNMACSKCHGAFTGYTSARHVNGNVEWDLSGIAANATYKGSVKGGTGKIALGEGFGSCANLYCHSNVQGTDGTGAPTAYYVPVWGGSATCGSCHVDMYTSPAATGGHKQHSQASDKFATPFDCRICHGNGGTTNPLNHANGTINMEFDGYGAGNVYKIGGNAINNVVPGSGFGTCDNSNCHGTRRTMTWGASSNVPLCEKCHGSKASEGGFYGTSGPGTAASNTDPIVGAHGAHIHQEKSNPAFTLYTSYSAYKDCSECHIKPAGPYDAGHIDTALPAEVTFQPGAIANRAVFYGFSGAQAASYNLGTCSNIWCHGAAMDSNVGRGTYAQVVADGGTLGTPRTPVWNQPFLNGNPLNDCSKCHGYPPPGPTEDYAHFSHYSTVLDAQGNPVLNPDGTPVEVAKLKQPNECNGCHVNVKPDGSGFINSATHINGNVDKGCQACHGVPPNTVAELAIQSNGALAAGQAGAHKAHALLPAIGKNCSVCHNGYASAVDQMPNMGIEMGFNAYNGKAVGGAFWGYSTVSNGLTSFVSTGPGTYVFQTNNLVDQNTCAVYCHGLTANAAGTVSATIGGRFNATAKPVWDTGAAMVCGNCHGVNIATSPAYASYTAALNMQSRPASSPTSSSHGKHASPTSAMNLTCDVCHGVITNFYHVNGSVAWRLDTANPRVGAAAVYGPAGNQVASGATGNVAPSASYGSCNNLYCHSSGQSADGSSSIPSYVNQQWGATVGCGACHNDMSTAGTGNHVAHAGTSGGNYDCSVCHGSGYLKAGLTAPATATHVDMQINVSMAGATYSKTSPFGPGLGYGSCSTSLCHGQGTPTWGTTLYSTTVQCQKCHADQNSALFYSTAYPGQVTATSDPRVGVHTAHLKASHGMSVSAPTCSSCHPAVTAVNDSGHMNGTTNFVAGLNYSGGSCTNSCHKKAVSWSQSQSFFTGDMAHDCTLCHDVPAATVSHTQAVRDDYAARGFVSCLSCHWTINGDGTFNDLSSHMNGQVEALSGGGLDCSGCHTSLSAMTSDTTTYHHVVGSTAVNYGGNTCLKCHADHDIFQVAQNSANTIGRSANLRVDNAVVPTQTAPDNGTGTGTYTNTDFVAAATNGGICVSCHNTALTKDTTNQKYSSPDINTTTMVVTRDPYAGSMHNYTTSSTFSKDGSKFLANCVKCHSDSMAETKQVQPKTFGLHLSTTRELFTGFQAAPARDAREDRLCFGCHSQTSDVVDSGQTVKPANGKDWYGNRVMRTSAEDTFNSFSSATRVYRHNVGKYNAKHKANEDGTYIGANKHVECADCHNSHGAKFGNHTLGSATLANALAGATGVAPSYGGAGSTGLPGVTGTTLYLDATTPPASPNGTHASGVTFTTSTWQSMGMSNAAPSSGTASTKTITTTATSGNYNGQIGLVSPVMTNGATLNSQTVTLTIYANCASATSAPRLYGTMYLWNGTTATQLVASTQMATLTTTSAAYTLTANIPQTTIANGSTVLVAELYPQSRGSAQVVTFSYNGTGAQSRFVFTPGATWSTASSYTAGAATQEYQICFKCHSNANPNLATWGGSAAAAWTDLALEFNPNNASRHPIGTPLASGSRLTTSQLNGGWTPGMVMNCSDCHATDSAASKGPHGSSVKWMLAGTNKAWPYTLASQNGGSTGTLFRLATYNTGVGTKDGLFCLNCHQVTGTNNFHSASGVSTGTHYSNATMAGCVACHIRVPHGGKVTRLRLTTNAPTRYRADGNATSPAYGGWAPPGSTAGSSTIKTNTCGQHNGASATEAW